MPLPPLVLRYATLASSRPMVHPKSTAGRPRRNHLHIPVQQPSEVCVVANVGLDYSYPTGSPAL